MVETVLKALTTKSASVPLDMPELIPKVFWKLTFTPTFTRFIYVYINILFVI